MRVRGRVVVITGASSGIGETPSGCRAAREEAMTRPVLSAASRRGREVEARGIECGALSRRWDVAGPTSGRLGVVVMCPPSLATASRASAAVGLAGIFTAGTPGPFIVEMRRFC
jgi:NAD(P)-dependent dehydrogenase (short-subunit alcohol dehydrogenase family)